MADNLAFDIKDENITDVKGDIHEGKGNEPDTKSRWLQTSDVLYGVDDSPPWYLCIILGFQHYLIMFGSTLSIPLLLMPKMCVQENDVATSEVISTIFFVSGILTLLQTTVGTRLPIVQGGSFAFLVPAMSILALPEYRCPATSLGGNTDLQGTMNTTDPDMWKIRMREIQGAVIGASAFQVAIGATGLAGFITRAVGPLTVAPTVALIGCSLFKAAAGYAADQWYIALMTIFLVTLFTQYLKRIRIPCGHWQTKRAGRGSRRLGFPIFEMFPIILAIIVSWIICYIFTVTNVFANDKDKWGYQARTDVRKSVLSDAAWFRFPYPFQWGIPTFSVASVFGMLAGVLAGIVESIGDYYACARLAGAPPPPIHAINRGIFIEGIDCILDGIWGTGNGSTSYSQNVGAIGLTKVGSRRVVQYGAVIMLLLGMLGKFGALFATIPDPIIGGIFMVIFGMIVAVGVSNLQYVDLNSSRNLYIFGFSFFFGLSLPQWMSSNQDAINTGNETIDKILTVLFSTSMFIGGASGFILDNTIPGTLEERGLTVWRAARGDTGADHTHLKCYDLPLGMSFFRRMTWTKYIPICPTFVPCSNACCCDRGKRKDTVPELVIYRSNGTGSQQQDGTNNVVHI